MKKIVILGRTRWRMLFDRLHPKPTKATPAPKQKDKK